MAFIATVMLHSQLLGRLEQMCPSALKLFSGPVPVGQLLLAFHTGEKAELTIRRKSVEVRGVCIKASE